VYADEQGTTPPDVLPDDGAPGLRQRHKRPKKKPYFLDSADEAAWSSGVESSCPATPIAAQDDYFTMPYDADAEMSFEIGECMSKCADDDESAKCHSSILPQYAGQPAEGADGNRLSLMESVLDWVAPYCEMTRPDCNFDTVLARLLTEWYAVGASLLAVAA
jgi:hypothetical protein